VLIPWSAFWDRNYFLEWSSALGAFLTSNYTRGAISGLGLINVWAAVSELGDLFGSRKSAHQQSDDPRSGNPQSDIDLKSDIRNLP
jgi:hypothetical protein